LFDQLQNGEVKNPGLVLGVAGYRKIIEENNLEEGLPLVTCAAENYYDDLAMHNLGQIYRLGEHQKRYLEFQEEWATLPAEETQSPEAIEAQQALEALYPDILKSADPLPMDNKQSLFWAFAAEVLDPIKHKVFTDSMRSVGWNNIAVIDTIVNTDVLTRPEMQQVECELGVFLGKRYPDLGDSTATCEYRETSTETISAYMQDVYYNLLTARYAISPEDLVNFPLGSCKKLDNSVFGSDKVINSIKAAAGGNESNATCVAIGEEYAVSVPLPESPGNSWCVDSSLTREQIKGVITDVVCK
jgi:hypothetical protein